MQSISMHWMLINYANKYWHSKVVPYKQGW